MTLHRTTFLLGKDVYERYRLRARQRGTTVSEEIRRALEKDLEDENPNQRLLELAGDIREIATSSAPPAGGPWPPADSEEAKEQMVRDLYRDATNREPDW
ncbi:MAG: hypothetical protein HUU14_06705 [Dehalococcoidia bacterium]|nr:hypothetical protein [Chloroflexi bacterium CFX7]MCK6564753.1 hypothetical protein [Dehalococcoidia bacterium]NUQ55557.1 hypothetical protein [Dehalococcoidia bacterium]